MKINSIKKLKITLSEEEKETLCEAMEIVDNITTVMEKENLDILYTSETTRASFSIDELEGISQSLLLLKNKKLIIDADDDYEY